MKTFSNLRIGARLALVLGGVLLMTIAVALSGLWGLNTLYGTSERVLTSDVALAQHASEIQNLVLQSRRFEKDALINLTEMDKLEGYLKKWADVRRKLDATITKARTLAVAADDTKALDEMAQGLKSYAAGFEATAAQMKAGQLTTPQMANAELGKVKPFTHAMETASDAMATRAMDRASHAMEAIGAVRMQANALQIGLAAAGLLFATLCCWAVTRSITRPIQAAVSISERVASGDLRAQIEVDRHDETGQLLAALKRMNDSLQQIVGQVRQSSDSIATGASQIATGNADLSQRTEEQASSLQQTAAAMEQITATVRTNVDTAREASLLAGQACNAAAEGGSVVGSVIATMAEISDSSKKIADIIGVIDGIAFQTNILALNAAVEAARAGEHGRGFAVVAAEVRGLAQRSAQAAREIKGLIGASVDKVEAGTRLVGDAGRSMEGIVEQVQRVSALITEISGASVEQSGGIGQVGTAVQQLDQMTQQNAALVEESAAAAESLNQQARKLTHAVAVFQV
ncbi:methyl-accepting chemotaxis protein [Aquabacterium humicola]|uniref:methyl-accepting chemotaxis protein n=1 Tax=Aquabacterium humicola TaxID=3237377 RepID=UPI00254353E1|nr:methyl-accepting chemotaxis protein [Rubrivivax pictus]